MTPERLFVERCEQLAVLLGSHRELELLDLAGRLRQLLFDQKSLVDTVNVHLIKLEFRVGCFELSPTSVRPDIRWFEEIRWLEDGLDPETARPGSPSLTITRDEFSRYPVGYIRGEPITVRNVIRYAALVAGGVHHDPQPRSEFQILNVVSQKFNISGMPLSIHTLKAIGRVTIRALHPLLEDVKKRT